MNLVYDYEILFNEDIISNINFYQVEKDDAFSTDFSHILYLNNNQYRIVSISSDKSFENLQSNPNPPAGKAPNQDSNNFDSLFK